jgi:hypothetical protein
MGQFHPTQTVTTEVQSLHKFDPFYGATGDSGDTELSVAL